MGPGCIPLKVLSCPLADLQAFVLSSVELQVLTGSCFKLRTVHNIPVTSNKDGECPLGWRVPLCLRMMLGRSCGGPSAGAGSLLGDPGCAGGQLPTRWHYWSRIGLPGRAIPAATWGCFWGLSSTPMGWAGPGYPQGDTQPALLGTSPRAVQQQESSGCPAGMIGSGGYVSSSRP